ncbi:hypothetical protein CcaverHIS002_0207260 [Cutaneotrichosporon cavernicola]|nr:hypothetical protein CcaverHIS002_0207260 [Cutaneotrichosporon cavernicola]
MTVANNTVWEYTRAGRLSSTIAQAARAIPEPGPSELVIQVRAAALNPVDEQLAQSPPSLLSFLGCAIPSPSKPLVPTSDFAGVVVASKSAAYVVGDEVYGQRFSADGNGFLATYVKVEASAPFVKKPKGLGWTDAAAVPLVYTTVYDALVEWGRLSMEGEEGLSVLVLGGSSGTGHVAVQMAKKMGCNVVASCSGKNAEMVKSLGADEIIDYTTQNVPQAALMSRYAPYAVVLDCVGGTDLLPDLDNLLLDSPQRPELGIYVTIVGDKTSRDAMGGAATNLYTPAQAVRTVLGRLNDHLPRWTRGWTGRRYACIKLNPSKDKLESYEKFMEEGGKVIVDSVWPFGKAREAYERLESARAKGKVVVEVSK